MDTPTLTLRPKLTTPLALFLGSAVFVAGGILMLNDGKLISGWFVVAFFGLCAGVGLVQLLPGSTYLTIAPEGLTYATLYRVSRIDWNDVAHFSPLRMSGNDMIGIVFADHYTPHQTGRRVSTALAGCEGGLPSTYGMPAQELADLLNECRVKFATPAGAATA